MFFQNQSVSLSHFYFKKRLLVCLMKNQLATLIHCKPKTCDFIISSYRWKYAILVDHMLLSKFPSDLMLTLVTLIWNFVVTCSSLHFVVFLDPDLPISSWSLVFLDWFIDWLLCHVLYYLTFILFYSFSRQRSSNLYLSSKQTD